MKHKVLQNGNSETCSHHAFIFLYVPVCACVGGKGGKGTNLQIRNSVMGKTSKTINHRGLWKHNHENIRIST